MRARNGPERYGWVTTALHWSMAAAMLFMLGLGWNLVTSPASLDKLRLYAIHKSIGLTLLVLVIARLAWHRVSPVPPPEGDARTRVLARAVHVGLYLGMLAMPLSGWIASAATGLDVLAWGVTLPRIAPVDQHIEDLFFAIHRWIGWTMAGLISLHLAGALWHRIR